MVLINLLQIRRRLLFIQTRLQLPTVYSFFSVLMEQTLRLGKMKSAGGNLVVVVGGSSFSWPFNPW